ncbi:MAG: NAD-dependent epimerase/dehydratase family protein [Myxococcales bacterium]|nr:NAD-dependent epimerase/dehydratase family protein [Myxococcales bacterium]
MRILLTGAAGFIGSSVAEALLQRGDEVIGIDNLNEFYDPAQKRRNLDDVHARAADARARFVDVRADIVSNEPVLRELYRNPDTRPDAVCHLAAWAGVRPSIQKPLIYQSVNVEGTVRLLELSREFGVLPFVFASSSSVYGARTKVPFHETDPVDDPISPYAATKKAGELLGYTWSHLHGLHFIALRFFTVYGPRQRPEMAIHNFARRISRGEPIPVFGDGTTSRDYTYIDDIVRGVVAAIDRSATVDGHRIYNLGGSETTALAELIELLERALKRRAIIDRRDEQPGDVPRTYADISRATTELGYRPEVNIEAGITRFVDWLERLGSS